ncbi:hypothetical protein BC835DRAFT_1273768 [Cytidiella melzeri]|nr:hypothetical protein BC835DRAFT_1273768 [Cytidiella melzeri]
MLIDDHDTKSPASHQQQLLDIDEAGPSSSGSPPPPAFTTTSSPSDRVDFADSNYFVPPGGEEQGPPPPDFAPYEAEYFEEAADGSVVSHDPHLNEDGEALYRFLLSQSQIPPQLFLHVKGQHQEHQTRSVRRIDDRGHARWATETESVTVHDFDFHIDVSQYILQKPTQWSIPDEEPAYRGNMKLEVEGEPESARRRVWKASRQERKRASMWKREREMRGLPPWIGSPTPVGMPPPSTRSVVGPPVHAEMYENDVLKSTKTVRDWADEYCASDKMLKEFTYRKVVYGWNFSALEAAVAAAVKSTHYNGHLTVEFKRRGDQVHVRADNWLSRTLSIKWLVVLLWITLLYPFIWLYKRYAHGGGGKWEVCGGAYALKSWKLIDYTNTGIINDDAPPPFPGTLNDSTNTIPHFSASSLNSKTLVNTQMGVAEVVGMREGEWFQMWEGTIKRAVMGRLKSQVLLTVPDEGPLPAALMLDGYQARPLVSY